MTEYKVEILDGYGPDPDILDVHHFDSEAEALTFAAEHTPCRIAKVVDGVYWYRRFGEWERD